MKLLDKIHSVVFGVSLYLLQLTILDAQTSSTPEFSTEQDSESSNSEKEDGISLDDNSDSILGGEQKTKEFDSGQALKKGDNINSAQSGTGKFGTYNQSSSQASPRNSKGFRTIDFSHNNLNKVSMFDKNSIRRVILETNPEISLSKKIGKIDSDARFMLAFNLNDLQIKRYYELPKSIQNKLLQLDRGTVARLLLIDGISTKYLETFFSYNAKTRNLILELENQVILQLLDEKFGQELLSEALTKMNIFASQKKGHLIKPVFNDLENRTLSLSDRLRSSGNGNVMESIYNLADGTITEEWLRVGEVAEGLLEDYDLGNKNPSSELSVTEVFGNPFFVEANALFEELKLDALINGEQSSVLAGKNLIVQQNADFLNSFFSSDASNLILVSNEQLLVQEDFIPQFDEGISKQVVIMGGESLKVTPNIQLGSELSDLLISTNADLQLQSISLVAAKELAIRGYRDVNLQNSSISVEQLAMIKARRDLTIDGLSFKRDVSKIVMEATTMRLSNIDFPAISQVRLNTLKGGVAGRYPNFGNQISPAQQIGRVNFIENVRSGGNLLSDRPSFDLHGKNIEIGKLVRQ